MNSVAETDAWPVQKVEILKSLWAEGKSKSQIAEVLNTSPNAVTGKAKRLGLSKKKKTTETVVATKTIRPIIATPKTQSTFVERPPKKIVETPNKKVWTQRNNLTECAFPVDTPERPSEQLSCCNKIVSKNIPYCSEHYEIMYASKS